MLVNPSTAGTISCFVSFAFVSDQNLPSPVFAYSHLSTLRVICVAWQTDLLVCYIVLSAILIFCNINLSLAVAFRLYDLDRDDKISRDELLQVREFPLNAKQNN